jgi:hypothetical protein
MATAAELAGDAFYRRLSIYLARLRLDGVMIDAEQESRLVLLLSRLESSGAMPKSAAAIARMVVPVLASTPAQQAMCHDHFRAVFSDDQPAPEPHRRTTGELEEKKTWLQSLLRAGVMRATAAFMIAAAIALVALAVHSIHGRMAQDLEISPGPIVAKASDEQLLDWIRAFPLKELELPQQRPWNRTLRWFYAEFGWQKSVVAALPWLMYAAAFGGLVYLTLAQLRRESL